MQTNNGYVKTIVTKPSKPSKTFSDASKHVKQWERTDKREIVSNGH